MPPRVITRRDAQVVICGNAEELALEAARHFARLANKFSSEAGRFNVALSGGSTPRAMFSLLAAQPMAMTVSWSSARFFWADERCVPPDHPTSNYRMARETLLARVPVPSVNIFRVPAELPPEEAAGAYERTIGSELEAWGDDFFLAGAEARAMPRLDLVLLGMGSDCHTASLFPRTKALKETSRVVVANYVEKLGSYRITLTAPMINSARSITFLVSGREKAEALRRVLEGERDPENYPSQLIRPRDGGLVWLVDEGAAALLGADGGGRAGDGEHRGQ